MPRRGSTLLGAMLKEIGSFIVATPGQRRHSRVGWLHLWKIKREFQIRFLKKAGLRPEHYLLDIGCGTLRGGIPIIEFLDAGHYHGIDSRPAIIAEARQELHDANLEHKAPVLMCADTLSTLDVGIEFDYIWAFSVLIHMRDEILDDCLTFVSRRLRASGMFYANVNIGPPRDAWFKWQGFPVVWRPLEFYREVSARHGLDAQDMGTLKSLENVSGVRVIDEERMLRFRKASS